MQFNGLGNLCIFDGASIAGPQYITFDVDIKAGYVDNSIIGKRYMVASLYDGLINVYFGNVSLTTADLKLTIEQADGNIIGGSITLPLTAILNTDNHIKVEYLYSGIALYLNGTKRYSIAGPIECLRPVKTFCVVGGSNSLAKDIGAGNYFYGDIYKFSLEETAYEVDEEGNLLYEKGSKTNPIIRAILDNIQTSEDDGVYIRTTYPTDGKIAVHGVSFKVSKSYGVDRELVQDAYEYGGSNRLYCNIDRDLHHDYTEAKGLHLLSFSIDRSLRAASSTEFDIGRDLYLPVVERADITRMRVCRKLIPVLQIFNGTTTAGQMDGKLITSGNKANPVTDRLASYRVELSNVIRLAVRCIPNYRAPRGVTLTLNGAKDKWALSIDGISFLQNGEDLIIPDPVLDTNVIFWARFQTDFNKKLYDDTTYIRVLGEVEYDGRF